ncbi:hypothetical protein B0H19DRAFT_1256736 [Mycena capillaripes]|nr:hypothetical protein B0H19DRAFT_1256736 [Mycena capillaripes]
MGGPLPIRSLLLSRQNYEDIDESEEAIAVDEDEDDSTPMPLGIKASIRKLRKVIRAVRSSPQHRQQWCSILSPQNVLVIHAELLRQYFMSDAIVVWRAWILWQDSIRIKIFLSLCIFVSLVSITTEMSFIGLYLFGNIKFLPTGPRTLTQILPLMFTNIVATILFGILNHGGIYRVRIKEFLGVSKNRRTNVERILVILTESGGIYCLFWVQNPSLTGYILFKLTVLFKVPELFVSFTSTDPDNLGYKIVANMLPQLSAIYPVIIVLLVAMEKTHPAGLTTDNPVSQPIHFVHESNPTISTTSGPMRITDPETSGTDVDVVKEKRPLAQHSGSYVVSIGAGGDSLQ